MPRTIRACERGSCSGFLFSSSSTSTTSSRSLTVAVALLLLDDASPGECVVVARRPRVAICHSRPRAGAPSERASARTNEHESLRTQACVREIRACAREWARAHAIAAYRRTSRRAGLGSVARRSTSLRRRRVADDDDDVEGKEREGAKTRTTTGTTVTETGAKSRGAARAFAAPLSRSFVCPAGAEAPRAWL